MIEDCLWFAGACAAAATSWSPAARCRRASPAFLGHFDVVVRGEGEQTMASSSRPTRPAPTSAPCRVSSCAARGARARPATRSGGRRLAPPRRSHADLDALPFPARDLLPNEQYIRFGGSVRLLDHDRDEHPRLPLPLRVLQQRRLRRLLPRALARRTWSTRSRRRWRLGYDRISFADDVFTLDRDRVRGDLRRDRAPRAALLLGVPGPCRHLRRRAPRAR